MPETVTMEATPRGPRGGGRPKLGKPNPIDVHVGSRVRLRRTLLGMSQERLGEAIGLTFQQVQKYERGANRIGASRLYDLSRVLDVPVSFFFDDLSTESPRLDASEVQTDAGARDEPRPFQPDPMARRETLELVRAYYRIPDAQVRRRIFELTKGVALATAVATGTTAATAPPGGFNEASANPGAMDGDDLSDGAPA